MITLRKYQQTAYHRALTDHLLLADDKGLGKTVVSIETARYLMDKQQTYGPVLVIVPKTLVAQWASAITAQDSQEYPIVFLEVGTKLDKHFTSRAAFWVITYYEAVVKHHAKLARTFWSTVIVDEAHRIRNRAAQRTRAIWKLDAYRKLALTGTPLDKNPGDVWSILHWLAPKQFTSYHSFYEQHAHVETDLWGRTLLLGVKDHANFAKHIGTYTLHRSKREVAPQLPPKIIQTIPLELTPAQQKLYKRIEQLAEINLELDTGEELLVPNVLARVLRLQQCTCDPKLLGTDDLGIKMLWLLDWFNDNPDQSLLIFTRFSDTARRIAAQFDIPCVTGQLNTLTGDPAAHPVIVGTIDAMALGFNFGHITTSVFFDTHWSSIQMDQALDRTERDLDATEPRHIIHLLAQTYEGTPTVDQVIYDAVQQKLSTTQLVYKFLDSIRKP